MNGNSQHIGAIVKDLLCAVAVMHIPVDYRHAVGQTFADSTQHAEPHVVENTKAAADIPFRVMPGRSCQCVCIVDFPGCDCLDSGCCSTHGQPCYAC